MIYIPLYKRCSSMKTVSDELKAFLFAAMLVGLANVSSLHAGEEPFFQVWDEEFVCACSLGVAMDGTVLIFKEQREKGMVQVTRSEDGGKTWGRNNTVKNNIFVFADEYGVITGGGSWRGRGDRGVPYIFKQNIVCTRRGVPAKNAAREVRSRRNLFWQEREPERLRAWLREEQRARRETGSMVADPMFVDAGRCDFRLQAASPAISKIGFKPFDPRKAGLVGDAAWTSLPGKIRRPGMRFWTERSRALNATSETDRWRAGFTP